MFAAQEMQSKAIAAEQVMGEVQAHYNNGKEDLALCLSNEANVCWLQSHNSAPMLTLNTGLVITPSDGKERDRTQGY